MLTKAEATQQGQKFADQWDMEKHTVSQESMKTFAAELNSMNDLPAAQKNSLKWAELRGATDGLISSNVLPNLDVTDDKTNLRNCRVVGLTADGDKNLGNDDLVIAIGRKKDNAAKAENVVVLGQDGKFYQARQVKGGYVRSQELIAENAGELERRYNRTQFFPKTESSEKPDGQPQQKREIKQEESRLIAAEKGNPADLEVFDKELRSFQRYSPYNEVTAQRELDRLARAYSELSKDQQHSAYHEVFEQNQLVHNDVWIRGLLASRPQVSIQRGPDGTIRFSADWTDGTTLLHRPRNHRVFSENYNL